MSSRRLGPVLSLIRQGVSLGLEFGEHSLEAMLWIAETVEESVYASGSLCRTAHGLAFVLANPPLRVGAFGAIRCRVAGRAVPPERGHVRTGADRTGRTFAEVTRAAPLELREGEPTVIWLEVDVPDPTAAIPIRLELESVAIPPLVWLEFTATPSSEAPR